MKTRLPVDRVEQAFREAARERHHRPPKINPCLPTHFYCVDYREDEDDPLGELAVFNLQGAISHLEKMPAYTEC